MNFEHDVFTQKRPGTPQNTNTHTQSTSEHDVFTQNRDSQHVETEWIPYLGSDSERLAGVIVKRGDEFGLWRL
jgi:hypothetical protein